MEESIDKYALAYVAGYTVRKAKKFTGDCDNCFQALPGSSDSGRDELLLISLKSRGYLVYPSDEVVELLKAIEMQIIHTAKIQNRPEIYYLQSSIDWKGKPRWHPPRLSFPIWLAHRQPFQRCDEWNYAKHGTKLLTNKMFCLVAFSLIFICCLHFNLN